MIKLDKILFPTDFSEYSKGALLYAVDLAKQYNAELFIQHVFDENILDPFFFAEAEDSAKYFEELEKNFKNMINNLVSEVEMGDVRYEPVLSNGTPFVEIVKYAKNMDIDMIVIATHGRTGISHFLLGSTAERVIQKAHCPVLAIRHPEFKLEDL
ncbi:universal stress protein [bacterium]|nr:universal stress protein [bacterium]